MNSPMPGEPPEFECVDQVARAAAEAYHASMDKRTAVLEMRFDSVLPTLATKVDIAELRAEIVVGNEKLRGEMAIENKKLRGEMAIDNEKLRGEMAIGNEKLRVDMAIGNEKLRVEMARMSADLREEMNKMFRKIVMWTVSTMIAMFLGMVGLFIGLTSAMIDAAFKPAHATPSVQQAPAPQAPR